MLRLQKIIFIFNSFLQEEFKAISVNNYFRTADEISLPFRKSFTEVQELELLQLSVKTCALFKSEKGSKICFDELLSVYAFHTGKVYLNINCHS